MNDRDVVLVAALLYRQCPQLREAVRDFVKIYFKKLKEERTRVWTDEEKHNWKEGGVVEA